MILLMGGVDLSARRRRGPHTDRTQSAASTARRALGLDRGAPELADQSERDLLPLVFAEQRPAAGFVAELGRLSRRQVLGRARRVLAVEEMCCDLGQRSNGAEESERWAAAPELDQVGRNERAPGSKDL
jgi:hypothetical protein